MILQGYQGELCLLRYWLMVRMKQLVQQQQVRLVQQQLLEQQQQGLLEQVGCKQQQQLLLRGNQGGR